MSQHKYVRSLRVTSAASCVIVLASCAQSATTNLYVSNAPVLIQKQLGQTACLDQSFRTFFFDHFILDSTVRRQHSMDPVLVTRNGETKPVSRDTAFRQFPLGVLDNRWVTRESASSDAPYERVQISVDESVVRQARVSWIRARYAARGGEEDAQVTPYGEPGLLIFDRLGPCWMLTRDIVGSTVSDD